MEDTFVPCFAFDGGNGRNYKIPYFATKIAEILSKYFCLVQLLSLNLVRRWCTSDGQGHVHTVHAKHAIVTTPLLVAARIIKNLDNASKAQMLGFRYGSYLVAIVCWQSRLTPAVLTTGTGSF